MIMYLRKPITGLRYLVQGLFLTLILWAGWDFYRFYQYLLDPSVPAVSRPSSVEAFLPISSMLAFRQWLYNGLYDPLHPAGLTLLLLIVASALLFRRAFCGWICPVGTVSEAAGRLGKAGLAKLGLKPWIPQGWAAYGLSALKYLLLAFFIYIIWFALDIISVMEFLRTPYNQVADIKMMLFFLEPSKTTIIVMTILVGLSLVIPNFWCRFLCPYGAMLGLFGKLSPAWLGRDKDGCIQCGACQRACLNGLHPQAKESVTKEVCTLCLSCAEICPQKVLGLKTAVSSRFAPVFSSHVIAVGLLILFFGGIGIAQWLGYWDTLLTPDQMRKWLPIIQQLDH